MGGSPKVRSVSLLAVASGLFLGMVGAPGVAAADPCTAAISAAEGTEFAGVVRHVIDGDSLCVGPAEGDGSTWIEVRLMDFDAPERGQEGSREAKRMLRQILFGEPASCLVTRGRAGTRSYDRVHALCRVRGRLLGDLMREGGAPQGGN